MGKGHYFWVPKPSFNFYSGDTLALLTWLTTKRVDTFKSTTHNDDNFNNMNYLT